MPPIDIEKLNALFDVLIERDITEFEHEDAEVRLRIVRGQKAHVVAHAPQLIPQPVAHGPSVVPSAAPIAAAAASDTPDGSVDITSPFVGTFYRAPTPDSPNFVDVGSAVRPGQTLCIVEAMKLMNEIESELSGTITEIFAQNGKAVEFGQKLFRVKKA